MTTNGKTLWPGALAARSRVKWKVISPISHRTQADDDDDVGKKRKKWTMKSNETKGGTPGRTKAATVTF